MDAKQIMEGEKFKKCADFHGHICPGLSIGFRAAESAMEWLRENRSVDEEIVAIVETDACSADAVQVLTGCTFGKGNFIYKDYGKMVLTLLSRKNGEGVRVAMKDGAFSPDETHMDLLKKVANGSADEEERKQFQDLHFKRSCDVLEMPEDDLFVVKPVQVELPSKAQIEPSKPCTICGEPTMSTKLQSSGSGLICRGCAEQSTQWYNTL